MASQGPNSPSVCANDTTTGSINWVNVDNVKIEDNVYCESAQYSLGGAEVVFTDKVVKIIKSDGSLGGEDKADTVTPYPAISTFSNYGSSSDLWGETWSYSDINNSNFGVVFSIKSQYYLKCNNFGFSIPANSTINGILVKIKKYSSGSFYYKAYIDNINITIYYTTAGGNSRSTSSNRSLSTNRSVASNRNLATNRVLA